MLSKKEYLKVYKKYLVLSIFYLDSGMGDIFDPRTANKKYHVIFYDLFFGEDYETTLSAIIDADGASPTLDIRFTPTGIKKLLKTNKLMQDEVLEIWNEWSNTTRFKQWSMREHHKGILKDYDLEL